MDAEGSESRENQLQQMLASLNGSQRESVLSDANTLQILAGPGTGKTKVLTSRVAYFVLERRIPPKQIIVVTFTSKAANEMKNRLKYLIGAERSNALFIGTFHTLCCRILRKHASYVDLKSNFVVADVAASKDILYKLREDPQIKISDFTRKKRPLSGIWGTINKAKNKGETCSTYSELYGKEFKDIAVLYRCYEAELTNLNLVDLDNLLIKTCELLQKKKDVLTNIKAIFVDEFEDTNIVQYELFKLMTMQDNNKEVTIVGDPDQSIYGFRNAQHLDFKNMQHDFPDIRVLNMEENYRSTGTILKAAHHVISQDSRRFDKSPRTNNPDGLPIFLISTKNEETQAEFVAKEIQNVVKESMGLISYKDIAVLMPMNFNSQQFEEAFPRYKIPFTIFGGDRFFDRAEVNDILSYLKFACNPKDSFSFNRAVNVPSRDIGSKTVNKIINRSAMDNTDFLQTIRNIGIGNSRSYDLIVGTVYIRLREFGSICSTLMEMMGKQESVAEIIRILVEGIKYKDYLKTCYAEDHEARWNNIVELISLAQKTQTSDNYDLPKTSNTAKFLEYCGLCANQKELREAEVGKVSLGTLRSAKGLEWPCVFIVTCNDEVIPHVKAGSPNEVTEECRLLYVGMTRSKLLTYCVMPKRRDYPQKKSRFFDGMDQSLYSFNAPVWDDQTRAKLSETIEKTKSFSPDDSATSIDSKENEIE